MRRGLCLLAALCLIVSVTFSARPLVSGDVAITTGQSHDIITSAPSGQPTDRSQDGPYPDVKQPAGFEESEDWPAKKPLSDLALLVPLELWKEGGVRKPEPAVFEAGPDDSPPQLLKRPPPAG